MDVFEIIENELQKYRSKEVCDVAINFAKGSMKAAKYYNELNKDEFLGFILNIINNYLSDKNIQSENKVFLIKELSSKLLEKISFK